MRSFSDPNEGDLSPLCEHVAVNEPLETVDGSDADVVYCYGHPKTPTRLRCSRCERPICGRCAIPASVGQHCPECVAQARREAPRVRPVLRATAPVVTAILIANVIVYIAQQLVPGVTSRFASFPIAIANGEMYRLATAMFLHSPALIFHLLFNMYVLWSYGPHVEQAYGSVRFAILYLLAGLAGSVTSYAFGGCRPSVGASGAIFGLVGALVVYLYNRRRTTFVQQYLNGLLLFVGINLVIGFIPAFNIDYFAHVGGLLGGAALGFAFDPQLAIGARNRMTVQAAATIILVLVGAGLVAWRTTGFSCFG